MNQKATILIVGTIDREAKKLADWTIEGGTAYTIRDGELVLFGGYTFEELEKYTEKAKQYGTPYPDLWPE